MGARAATKSKKAASTTAAGKSKQQRRRPPREDSPISSIPPSPFTHPSPADHFRRSSSVLTPLSSPQPELFPLNDLLSGSSDATLVASSSDVKGKRKRTESLSDSDEDQFLKQDLDSLFRPRDISTRLSPRSELGGADSEKSDWRQTELPLGVSVGDSCFVKDGNSDFWLNGFLKAFHPATFDTRKTGDRYEVVHRLANNKPIKVRRAQIVFMSDREKIATCKKREYEVELPELICDADTRPPTPSPRTSSSSSTSAHEIHNLSIADQLVEIRPHLHAVVLETYKPAISRIDLFFEGQQRKLDSMVRMGSIPQEVQMEIMVPELKRWALRAERGEGIPGYNGGGEPPRPVGSARYESLRPQERLQYVMSVLLPEAAIRLSILRRGRHGIEDQAAYDEAVETLNAEHRMNDQASWEARAFELNAARSRYRKELGLEEEGQSEYRKSCRQQKEFDEQMWKTFDYSSSGRKKKVVRYKE